MKKRTISLLLVVLAFCMLFGVGFASWVISSGQENEAQGQFVVDTVDDVRITHGWKDLDGNPETTENAIVFGYDPSYETKEEDWLTNTDVAQNMSVTLLVHVKDTSKSIKVTYGSSVEFNPNYINAPTPGTYEVNTDDPTDGSVTVKKVAAGEFEVTIKFGWGSAFEGKNPIEYYNGKEVDGTDAIGITTGQDNGDVALNALETIELYTNVAGFTLTIELVEPEPAE